MLTRPQVWARPITLAAATEAVGALEAQFDAQEDGPAAWQALLAPASRHAFGGRQVHDANIAATMLAHGELRILTANEADFARFAPEIQVVTLAAA